MATAVTFSVTAMPQSGAQASFRNSVMSLEVKIARVSESARSSS